VSLLCNLFRGVVILCAYIAVCRCMVGFVSGYRFNSIMSSSRCLLASAAVSGSVIRLQGWARDVNVRDRDETETLAFRDRDETETFGRTSGDETETRRSHFETRPRRDVCRSRDVTETLKCTFIVTNAVYY